MHRLKVGRAVTAFLLMTLAYAGVLLWVDRGRGLMAGVDRLYSMVPVLMLLSLASYGVRYARWHWLLARAGHRVPALRGFAAYLAGFAFTATPGKVGELLRVRYFQPMGVPPTLVVSAFVFERVFDLIVVLGMAAMAAAKFDLLPVVAIFVLLGVAVVGVLARYPHHLLRLADALTQRHLLRLARFTEVFARGFAHTAVWLKPLDLLVALLAGLAAWGLTAYAFVLLLLDLGLEVPTLLAWSIYPVAMLAGAASMLPGGFGSTEAVVIALLAALGASLANGTLAAIGIRIATLWFATLMGLGAVMGLELLGDRHGPAGHARDV